MAPTLRVLRAGSLTTVQDLGRPGYAHLGVPRSGAADPPSLRLANRLVGNAESAAALETTVDGCEVVLDAGRFVAVTGASARVTVAERAVGVGAVSYVPAGARVGIGPATAGVRSYLAVGGGVVTDRVLGSSATDLLSGLGPPPLRDGDVLDLGERPGEPPGVDCAPVAAPSELITLRLHLGPHTDWFEPASLVAIGRDAYTVTSASNRIGLRLRGPAPRRSPDRAVGELPSAGLAHGALQSPPGGEPVLFLADHPTTGGYPVLGVAHPDDLALAGQARPGTRVRFHVEHSWLDGCRSTYGD
jgi:biotin-dependent carboxylase-like uncharacterized protein